MLDSGAIDNVKLHFGESRNPSGEFGSTMPERLHSLESVTIRSNCKTRTFNVWAE